ncbi:hypothetical protein L195_g059894, partial [Trifolium pratense]
MGLPQYEGSTIAFGDSQPIDSTRSWEHANAIVQSNTTKPLLSLY